ncbi:MAG: MFS transporter, partial [Acidimicrobiales bacterium]|nr:MFS transporter [Acidimicrobiales bacterium]
MKPPERDADDDPTASPATAVAKPRGPLHEPNFRRLWANSIAYSIVGNAQRFVFGWLVLDGLNRSESDQGLVVFALGIPAIFFTLHAGVWADRHDRRTILIVTQCAAGAVMVGTA